MQIGLITGEDKKAYENQIAQGFVNMDQFDGYSMEALYRHVQGIRKQVLGIHALEKMREYRAHRGVGFAPTGGIDQQQKKRELLNKSQAIMFVLFQAEFYFLMKKDISEARRLGKEIYVLVSGEKALHCGNCFPGMGWQARLSCPTFCSF